MNDIQISERQKVDFSKDQIQVIKNSLCPKASDVELAYFLEVCKSRSLNPFAYQIHYVPRWSYDENRDVWAIQTGIGGLRSIAEDTGKFAGETEIVFYDKDGKEFPKIWTMDTNPYACNAGVQKIIGTKTDGTPITQEYRETVYWDAVCQTKSKAKGGGPTRMWTGKSGVQQLCKCAKAATLRAAFPEKLSHFYTDDEMAHLETEGGGEAREKSNQAQDFVLILKPETVARMEKLNYNTDAKKRAICNEAGNTVDGLDLQLSAVEYAANLNDDLKNQVKYCGYKNQTEVRRMLVKLGREHWNETDLKAFLNGDAVVDQPLEAKS